VSDGRSWGGNESTGNSQDVRRGLFSQGERSSNHLKSGKRRDDDRKRKRRKDPEATLRGRSGSEDYVGSEGLLGATVVGLSGGYSFLRAEKEINERKRGGNRGILKRVVKKLGKRTANVCVGTACRAATKRVSGDGLLSEGLREKCKRGIERGEGRGERLENQPTIA